MKKIFLMLVMVIVGLSGCQNKTAIDKFNKDRNDLDFSTTIGVEIKYSYMEEDIDVKLNFKEDIKNNVVFLSLFGLDVYVDEEFMYINVKDQWYKIETGEEIKEEFQEKKEYKYVKTEKIDGEEVINDSYFEKINGKTIDEVLVSPEDHVYTLKEYEDEITVKFLDNKIQVVINDYENKGIKFDMDISISGSRDKIVIPKEALEQEVLNLDDYSKVLEENLLDK